MGVFILWGCREMGEESVNAERESESGRGGCVVIDTPERKHQLAPPVSKFEVIFDLIKVCFCFSGGF